MMHIRSVDRSALILIHEPSEGEGLLGPALKSAGFDLIHRFCHLEAKDASAPLWVLMGGHMAVYETDKHPFLAAEIAAIRARLAAGQPMLGICLGAQLIAAAAGAVVQRGQAGPEIGVFPITLCEAAAVDPVFAHLLPHPAFAHWHGDTFDAVPGATRLASSVLYAEQAFRLGDSYGLQFHPELDAATYEEWLRAAPEEVERSGRSMAEAIEMDLPKLRACQPMAERLLERLAQHFAERCLITGKAQPARGDPDAPPTGRGAV